MGKITVTRTYHIGIPVNDIERAEKFYVDVLGMKVKGRGAGERESNRPFFELLGYWPENLRLQTAKGDVEVSCSSVQSRSSEIGKRTASVTLHSPPARKISIWLWRR